MGIDCNSVNENKRNKTSKNITSSEKVQFKQYKCKIKKDNTKYYGFFCKFDLISTIITREDSINENFDLDDNYLIKINNNNNWIPIKLKKIYNKYNILIFKILEINYKIINIPFLEIDNFDFMENMNHYSDNSQYILFYLKNGDIKYSTSWIDKVNQEDYTFKYSRSEIRNETKYVLIFNNIKKKLVGISMKEKSNKGFLVEGIRKEIHKNQINNKLDSSFNNINNNNGSYTGNDADFLGGESHLNIKYFKNRINDLNKKSSSEHIINKKSNSNLIEYNFGKNKNDNLEQNIDDINSICNKENNSNKANNNDTNSQNFEEQEKKNNLTIIKNENVDNKSENIPDEHEKDEISKKLNNIENNEEISKEISLIFVFKNGKELYLYIKESCTFDQVIEQLNEKYLWLKNIEIEDYQIDGKSILKNKTIKDNKLKDNSEIKIIECP